MTTLFGVLLIDNTKKSPPARMRKTKLQTYFNRKVKSITFQSARRNFLSEGVRCGASQKKPPKDSTRSTALGGSFWDVPQMCPLSQEIISHRPFYICNLL